jgi:hypothetical protein
LRLDGSTLDRAPTYETAPRTIQEYVAGQRFKS